MPTDEKEIQDLAKIIHQRQVNCPLTTPYGIAKAIINNGYTRSKPIAEPKRNDVITEQVDREWPEKKDCPEYLSIGADGYAKGWNACHDEFMRIIKKTPAKPKFVIPHNLDLQNLIKNVQLTDKSRNYKRSWKLTSSQAFDIAQAILTHLEGLNKK